ncbi:MAG: hypothetical protein ACXWVT_08980 [Burkholderiaceae bacterium]
MWKNLIKLLHFASLVGLAGGILVSLVLADTIDATSPSASASMHAAIALICGAVIVPSMIVILLTGMLLVVARPHLISARWVWAKAVLGVVTGAVTLLALQPAVNAAASMSATGALGDAAPGPLASAIASEHAAAWWTLGLVLVAMLVAVWRPRIGRPVARGGEGD